MNGIPIKSKIYQFIPDSSFADGFSMLTDYREQSALEMYLALIQKTPRWVNLLMSLRNTIVSTLGLKDLGMINEVEPNKKSSDYNVGDRVGIFILYANEHNEIILQDNDKHLEAKISLYVEPHGKTATVTINTVVHVKNTLGRVYMFFVGPVHKVIVPSILKKLPPSKRKL